MKTVNYKFLLITLISFIFSQGAKAQCIASFTYTDDGNGVITMQSTSDSIYNVWWQVDSNYIGYGDITTITLPNGTYEVCMFIEDSATSCYDNICQTIVVNDSTQNCTVSASFTFTDNGNGTFTFTDASTTSSGGLMYGTWFFGDGLVDYTDDFNNSILHTYVADGIYVVVLEAYDSLDNCTAYYTQTIVVSGVSSPVTCNAAFVMFPDSNNTNSFIVVNSSTGSNLNYFWDFGDGNTSIQAYPNYTYTSAGPFELCLTVSDSIGCTSTYCDSISDGGIILKQAGFTINVVSPSSTLSINDNLEIFSDINVYPNPAKELLNIDLSLLKNATVVIFVTDITGKEVAQIANNENQVGKRNYQWNVGGLQNGIYFLNIKTDNTLQVKKVMINR